MKSIKRNPNARIFDKSNITEFELPLLTNKENSQQQYKNADLDHSTDYDYNKFFLDLLND
ncbi:hypothetical protein A6J72_07255 [Streptococcus intermedius]|nr:hypothetical protein [Streptococcus intermedius]ARC26993.1 hypothetical protein A6J72_07255 [Streptococcus intermedius]